MPEAVSTSNIVLFESSDGEVRLDVASDRETVWLSQQQMASLFGTTKQNVSLHVNNCFKEGELQKEAVVKDFLTTAKDGKKYSTAHYHLDVIISVGYRVKSHRWVEVRRWATDVLRRYIVEGRAENEKRLAQLAQVISVMERFPQEIGASQILEIVRSYAGPRSAGRLRPSASRTPRRIRWRIRALLRGMPRPYQQSAFHW